jgi:hypothetical protein
MSGSIIYIDDTSYPSFLESAGLVVFSLASFQTNNKKIAFQAMFVTRSALGKKAGAGRSLRPII